MTRARPMRIEVSLPIREEWQTTYTLRMAVLHCLGLIFEENKEFLKKVEVVIGEITENAIKYGDWKRDNADFRLRVHGEMGKGVDIEASNPIHPQEQHYEKLAEILRWVEAFPSPRDAYIARLKELARSFQHPTEAHNYPKHLGGRPEVVALQPFEIATSQLGLIRMVCEAECRIKVELDKTHHVLTIYAHCQD